ncbi:MAG: (Fe-S)-binding protein, partial [Firmicutes bacterium]|nr:(Fe-S)-binding protein [Bacillota bacterium]
MEVSDEVQKCSRCGYCQAVCPVYAVSLKERCVARGHNLRVQAILREKTTPLLVDKNNFFDCLLCRACFDACFAGVKTCEVVMAARNAWCQIYGNSLIKKLVLRHIIPHPSFLSLAVTFALLVKRAGIIKSLKALGLNNRCKPLNIVDDLLGLAFRMRTYTKGSFRVQDQKEVVNPGKAVLYFGGCGIRLLFPEVARTTERILQRIGFEVVKFNNYCCGLPSYTYADVEGARKLIQLNLRKWEQYRNSGAIIVTDCSSCASFLKDYEKLMQGTPEETLAREFSAQVRDVVEVIADYVPYGRLETSVTFHYPCHLSRYQNIGSSVNRIMQKIRELDYRVIDEAT